MSEINEPTTEYVVSDDDTVKVTTYSEADLPELLASIGYEQYQLLEWLNEQTIAFRKWFVDITGDLIAGLMLSQIHYWHGRTEDKKRRLRIKKDGHFWLCKADNEWWDEIRITEKQARRARLILQDKRLIVTKTYRFNNVPKTHIRINKLQLMVEIAAIIKQAQTPETDETSRLAPQGKSDLPPRASGLAPQGKSLTKTTTETNNTPPPKADDDSYYPVQEEKIDTGPLPQEVEYEYVPLDDDGYPTKRVHPLVSFIQGMGRKLTPKQQDKLAQGVPLHNPRYPAPTTLFEKDPLFEEYIREKVNWATGGIDGKRKTTGNLVAAIRNYETEKFGWLDWRQERVEKAEQTETTHTPVPPGWEERVQPDYISPEAAYTMVGEMGMKFAPDSWQEIVDEWERRGVEWDRKRLKDAVSQTIRASAPERTPTTSDAEHPEGPG